MLIESRPVSRLERILLLKRSSTLASLSAADIAVVAEQTRERFFRKGEWALREGESIPALYVVVDGTFHVRRRGRDIGHACAGAAVGALGIVAGDEAGLEARAETDVLTLELPADALLDLMEDHFSIYRQLLQFTCRSIVDLWSRGAFQARTVFLGGPLRAASSGLDLVDRIMFLRQGGPFARASINALAELSHGLVELAFEAGTAVWRAGDPARGVMLLVSGELECVIPASGHSFRARPGTPLGAAESIAGLPRFHDAVALDRTVCLYGDMEGLLDVFEDNFDMAASYLAALSRRLLELVEATSELELGMLGCGVEPEAPSA